MTNDWLKEKLQYDKVFESFERVFSFYGEYFKSVFINEVTLQMNDKKARKTLGKFSPFILEITLNAVRDQILRNQLDCVIAHETAHLIDHVQRSKYSNYKYSSSRRGSKERVIAEVFRSKMSPTPQKRANYRGRTCELFARAIEEYYAIYTKNEGWINQHADNDYYVTLEDFKKIVLPVVENYIKGLKLKNKRNRG